MMNTKLTLKMDQEVIDKAKKYAVKQKLSLSRIVESYLQSLSDDEIHTELEISPFVKSMATGTNIPHDLDYKKEYSVHLEKKYK